MVTVAKLPKGHIDLTRKVLLELKQVCRLFHAVVVRMGDVLKTDSQLRT